MLEGLHKVGNFLICENGEKESGKVSFPSLSFSSYLILSVPERAHFSLSVRTILEMVSGGFPSVCSHCSLDDNIIPSFSFHQTDDGMKRLLYTQSSPSQKW